MACAATSWMYAPESIKISVFDRTVDVSHDENDQAGIRNNAGVKAIVDKTNGNIAALATRARPSDIVAVLSKSLATQSNGLKLAPLEIAQPTTALTKALQQKDYTDFNNVLATILHARGRYFDENLLMFILNKAESVGTLTSWGNQISSWMAQQKTKSTSVPVPLSTPEGHQNIKLLGNKIGDFFTEDTPFLSNKMNESDLEVSNSSLKVKFQKYKPRGQNFVHLFWE